MFNIFNMMSGRNLKKLDAELSKMNYDEILGGLQELYRTYVNKGSDKYAEEIRVLYVIIECVLEMRKVYGEG